MATYIITFEINEIIRRNTFKKELQNISGTYCPIHQNAWAISIDWTARQLRDHLLGFIRTSDRLFIIKSGWESAWYNSYGEDNSQWLKNNL